MENLRLSRCALSVCVAAVLLVGCGGPQSALAPPVLAVQANLSHATAGHPGIKKLAGTNPLLYVSDMHHNLVYAFSWVFCGGVYCGRQVGRISLAPRSEPAGMCTDKHGNIWIAELGLQQLVEYKNSDFTKVIGTLRDPGQQPISCSFNRATGDIAVANYRSIFNGSGSVYVYPGGKSPPDEYFDIPNGTPMNWLWFVGYDMAGNLFANGCIVKCGPAAKGYPGGAAAGVQIASAPASCLPASCNGLWVGDSLLPAGSGLHSLQDPGVIQNEHGLLDIGDQEALPPCPGLPPFGCAALYLTLFGPGPVLRERLYIQLTSTLYTFQIVTSLGHLAAPNPSGRGCVSKKPCIQIYGAGPGIAEIYPSPPASFGGFPKSRFGLFGAVLSK